MGCRPAEGPLTLAARREAKQSQRTLGAATFFSPAGFCAGRAKPGQRSPCHEACPGPSQRLHAACGRTLAFGTLGLVAFGFFSPAACARRAGLWVAWRATSQQRVCRAPQLPPRVQRPELVAVSAYADAVARAGVGQGSHGQAGLQDGCGLFANRGLTALGALGFLAGAFFLSSSPSFQLAFTCAGARAGIQALGC